MRRGGVSFLTSLLVVLFFWQSAHADCPTFSTVIANGAYGIADSQGRVLGACNEDTPLIPASIIKITTALTALRVLGADYRFKTELFIDTENNLFVRGFGDPFLISEEVLLIMEHLKKQGITTINDIYIDDSQFALEHQTPGRKISSNPYDAPIGATVVNFNSVSIRIDKKKQVYSAEPQTPTLPIMKDLGKHRPPGRYQVNVCQSSCKPKEQMARFSAELFRSQQLKSGVGGKGISGRKTIPKDARLLHTHFNSKTLSEMLASMLKYSNNLVANLVYLTVGAERYGYPANWSKAKKAIHEIMESEFGPETASIIALEEGSGLSRNNRVSVRFMLAVLNRFRPYAHLLRKREQTPLKSGTMKGVYNYAGYLQDGKPFVILLNQDANTRGTVLERLKLGRYPTLEFGPET